MAPEFFVQFHTAFATAALEDIFAVRFRRRPVENVAALDESFVSILVEYFGPDVAVIPSGISPAENVCEIGVTVTWFDLRDQSPFAVQHLLFESVEVDRPVFGDRVDIHVRKRGGQQFGCGETLIEQRASLDFFDQIVRHWIARLVMFRIHPQHIRFERPVFHQLGGEFDEILFHAADTCVMYLGEKAMQRVAELMEEGFGFVEVQQRHSVGSCRAAYVRDDRYDRSDTFAFFIALFAVSAAPCAALLARAREEIEIEDPQVFVILVQYFVSYALLVVNRHRYGPEGNAPEAVAELENTLHDIVEREVGAKHLLVEVVLFPHNTTSPTIRSCRRRFRLF